MSLEVWRTLLFSRKTSSVIGNPMFGTLVWNSSLHFREVKTSKQSRGYLVRKTSQEQKTLGHWILSNEVLKKKPAYFLKTSYCVFQIQMTFRFLDRFSLYFGSKVPTPRSFITRAKIFTISSNISWFISFDLQVSSCIFGPILCYMELLYK